MDDTHNFTINPVRCLQNPPQDRFGRLKEVIGAPLYLSTRTRLDIDVAIAYLARDSSLPNEASSIGVKRILRYLRGSTDFGIFSAKGEMGHVPDLMGFALADWDDDTSDCKSKSNKLICMDGAPFAWHSRKQKSVAQ